MGAIFFKPPVMDTSVNLESRHPLHFRDTELHIGRKGKDIFRTLLKFDLSQLPFALPIFSSTLYLFPSSNYYDQPQAVQLFQVLSRWNQKTVSGNDFPLIAAAPVDSILKTKQCSCYLAFNVTPLIAQWQSNLSANLGVMVKTKCEMDANSLFSFCSSEFKDSSYWPYIEINYLEPEKPKIPCVGPLDLQLSVETSDEISCTNSINTLCYNYSYLVVNNGDCPATAWLQISPDGKIWLTETAIVKIPSKELCSLVPNNTAKYSRLCYTSAAPGQCTDLTVYIQGTS